MSNSNIAAMQAALKAKRDAGELERLDPIQKSIQHPNSLTKAIRAMCFECVGRNDDPNPRKEVAHCTSWDCPQWDLRPWQKSAPQGYGQEKRAAAVSQLTRQVEKAAIRSPNSKRKAINATCAQCMGIGNSELVHDCTSTFPKPQPSGYCGCPLWPHRPKPRK